MIGEICKGEVCFETMLFNECDDLRELKPGTQGFNLEFVQDRLDAAADSRLVVCCPHTAAYPQSLIQQRLICFIADGVGMHGGVEQRENVHIDAPDE